MAHTMYAPGPGLLNGHAAAALSLPALLAAWPAPLADLAVLLPLLLPPPLVLLPLLLGDFLSAAAGLVSLNLSLEPNFMPVELRALEACSSKHKVVFKVHSCAITMRKTVFSRSGVLQSLCHS